MDQPVNSDSIMSDIETSENFDNEEEEEVVSFKELMQDMWLFMQDIALPVMYHNFFMSITLANTLILVATIHALTAGTSSLFLYE